MINKNLTKIELAKGLSKTSGYPTTFSSKVINDLIKICTEMIKNNELTLKNIGTFKLISKKKRIGRNPKTKEEYLINKRKSISFRASKNLSKFLNDSHG